MHNKHIYANSENNSKAAVAQWATQTFPCGTCVSRTGIARFALADVRRGWSPGCVRWRAAVSLRASPYWCTWADPAGWSMCALQGNIALRHRWAGSLTPGSSCPGWGSGRCPWGTLVSTTRRQHRNMSTSFQRQLGEVTYIYIYAFNRRFYPKRFRL